MFNFLKKLCFWTKKESKPVVESIPQPVVTIIEETKLPVDELVVEPPAPKKVKKGRKPKKIKQDK